MRVELAVFSFIGVVVRWRRARFKKHLVTLRSTEVTPTDDGEGRRLLQRSAELSCGKLVRKLEWWSRTVMVGGVGTDINNSQKKGPKVPHFFVRHLKTRLSTMSNVKHRNR